MENLDPPRPSPQNLIRFGLQAACSSLISGEGRGGGVYSIIVGMTIDKLVCLLFKEMPKQILVQSSRATYSHTHIVQ